MMMMMMMMMMMIGWGTRGESRPIGFVTSHDR